MSERMTRRGFVRVAAGLSATGLVAMGFGPGDQLVLRKARFIERGDDVYMELDVPELFPAIDKEALRALDSHTPTTLVFEIGVTPSNKAPSYKRLPIATSHHEVKLWLNPWTSPPRYELTRFDDGKRRKPRLYTTRDAAVAAATHLRVRIASVAELGRGRSQTYFVRIAAFRNPIDPPKVSGGDQGRSRNQDVAYFRRWVSMFVSTRRKAEVALDIRTLPDFYLPEPADGTEKG